MLIENLSQTLESICKGQHLTKEQSFYHFKNLVNGAYSSVEISAFITALKSKGETPGEIAGAIQAMRTHVLKDNTIVDCAGTGGDGLNTINISTAVAIVGSVCGLKVAKWGNRSVSSKCGSADLLESVGINIEIPSERVKIMLDQTNFCFLYAPYYNKGAAIVKEIRSILKVRTIFNLILPLLNPMAPDYQLIGVYDPKLCQPLAEVLKQLGCKRALVVHGSGLDEIALHGPTTGALLSHGQIDPFSFTPEEFGLKKYALETIQGGTPDINVEHFLALLKGQGSEAYRASVAINGGALLWIAQIVSSIQDGVKMIQEILHTDQSYQHLHKIIEASHAQ